MYFNVKLKLVGALLFAAMWTVVCVWIMQPWIVELTDTLGVVLAWAIITGIAIIPGIANAFLLFSLAVDRRPDYTKRGNDLPPITILIAAYNEGLNIKDTLTSILLQQYPNDVEIIVIDDCSTDDTSVKVDNVKKTLDALKKKVRSHRFTIKLLHTPHNMRKAGALNLGLRSASYDHIITIDGDTYLYKNALKHIMQNMVYGPTNTGAVAGSVLVRNSRKTLLTRMQEWDYFHGIAVVKRTQSLYQGTLVAQGAFSVYTKEVLHALGGWPETIGEDIVLTWGIHKLGYRVGYAENAIVFTNAPEKYEHFYNQRKRWARGLIEAFKKYPEVVWRWKLNTPFILLNLTFPFIDFIFMFVFLPGVIAALFFKYYLIAGIMTLFLLPLAIVGSWLMFLKQRRIFRDMGLTVRKNFGGFLFYVLFYQIIMTPASLGGYIAEFLNLRKTWGVSK